MKLSKEVCKECIDHINGQRVRLWNKHDEARWELDVVLCPMATHPMSVKDPHLPVICEHGFGHYVAAGMTDAE